eukprot:3485616-Amphidinium_carterae.1
MEANQTIAMRSAVHKKPPVHTMWVRKKSCLARLRTSTFGPRLETKAFSSPQQIRMSSPPQHRH